MLGRNRLSATAPNGTANACGQMNLSLDCRNRLSATAPNGASFTNLGIEVIDYMSQSPFGYSPKRDRYKEVTVFFRDLKVAIAFRLQPQTGPGRKRKIYSGVFLSQSPFGYSPKRDVKTGQARRTNAQKKSQSPFGYSPKRDLLITRECRQCFHCRNRLSATAPNGTTQYMNSSNES